MWSCPNDSTLAKGKHELNPRALVTTGHDEIIVALLLSKRFENVNKILNTYSLKSKMFS